MKTVITLVVMLVVFGAVFSLAADHHHNKRIVVNSVVAVPVAVPVATFSPVKYSNQVQPYTDPPKSERAQLLDLVAEHILSDPVLSQKLAEKLGGTVQPQALKPTMFATKCAACHAKNKVDEFLTLDSLDNKHRLAAIQAIVTEKMPKGTKLTPAEVGQLMLELSTVPEVKASVEAPPTPEPPAEAKP